MFVKKLAEGTQLIIYSWKAQTDDTKHTSKISTDNVFH